MGGEEERRRGRRSKKEEKEGRKKKKERQKEEMKKEGGSRKRRWRRKRRAWRRRRREEVTTQNRQKRKWRITIGNDESMERQCTVCELQVFFSNINTFICLFRLKNWAKALQACIHLMLDADWKRLKAWKRILRWEKEKGSLSFHKSFFHV